MKVKYVCPHCNVALGELEAESFDEARLGFHFLTLEERKDIITYNLEGDMVIRISCDYCQDAVMNNPELALVKNPLQ